MSKQICMALSSAAWLDRPSNFTCAVRYFTTILGSGFVLSLPGRFWHSFPIAVIAAFEVSAPSTRRRRPF